MNNNMNIEEDPDMYMDPIFEDDLPDLVSPDEDGYSPFLDSVPVLDEYAQYDDLYNLLQGIDFLEPVENEISPEEEIIDYDYQYEPIRISRMQIFEQDLYFE